MRNHILLHDAKTSRPLGATFTVGSLIRALRKLPHDTPVVGEWDSDFVPLDKVTLTSKRCPGYKENPLVVLDVSDPWNWDRVDRLLKRGVF